MGTGHPEAPEVFISYSHADRKTLEELLLHLKPLRDRKLLDCWSDREIDAGQLWREEIERALGSAKVAVLLVSPSFLASDFIAQNELPPLLADAQRGKLTILWVPVSHSLYRHTEVAHYQAAHPSNRPLDGLKKSDRQKALVLISEEIIEAVRARSPKRVKATYDRMPLRYLLEHVRSIWIDEVYRQSLPAGRLLAIETAVIPEALERLPSASFDTTRSVQKRPITKPIGDIYEEANHRLLILGEPGAGKTTLLLQLASVLMDRCESDREAPIPVVFNLSSWTTSFTDLGDWLARELVTMYGIPQRTGRLWLREGQLLPLLDGLDELSADRRNECVKAINAFLLNQSPKGLVVVSRERDYLELSCRLHLGLAIRLCPLRPEEIESLLAEIGDTGQLLQTIISRDAQMRTLVLSPLMLTLIIRCFQGAGDLSIPPDRKAIFDLYVNRALASSHDADGRDRARHRRWLGFLAYQMFRHGSTRFQLSDLQPSWLQGISQHALYLLACFLFPGILFFFRELCFSSLRGSTFSRVLLMILTFVLGSLAIPLVSIVKTIGPELKVITFAERLQWSRGSLKPAWWIGIRLFLATVAVSLIFEAYGLLTGGLNLRGFILSLLYDALVWFVLTIGLSFVLFGLEPTSRLTRLRFDEGFLLSVRTSIFVGFVAAGVGGTAMMAYSLAGGEELFFANQEMIRKLGFLKFVVVSSIDVGSLIGLIVALIFGGYSAIQHFMLRVFLWVRGVAPFRWVVFLRHSASCGLLKDGITSFLFFHPYLQAYFGLLGFADTMSSFRDTGSALLERAALWLALGDYDEALRDLDRAAGDSRIRYSAVMRMKAEVRYAQGDIELAIGEISEAIKFDEGSASDLGKRAAWYYEIGESELALEDLKRLLRGEDDPVVQLEVGKLSYLARDFVAAATYLNRSIEGAPENGSGYHWRSIVKYTKNDTAGAIEDEGRAIECNPLNYLYYEWRGGMWLMLHQREKSLVDLRTALQINPGASNCSFWQGLGHLWASENKNAVASFEAASQGKADDFPYQFWIRVARNEIEPKSSEGRFPLAAAAEGIADEFERYRLLGEIHMVFGLGEEAKFYFEETLRSRVPYHRFRTTWFYLATLARMFPGRPDIGGVAKWFLERVERGLEFDNASKIPAGASARRP